MGCLRSGSGDYRFRGSDTSAVGRRGRSFAGPLPNLSAGLSSLLVGSPPSWMINGSAPSGAFYRADMAASLLFLTPPSQNIEPLARAPVVEVDTAQQPREEALCAFERLDDEHTVAINQRQTLGPSGGNVHHRQSLGRSASAFDANPAGVLLIAAITATRRRTKSSASAGSRSSWPSGQRYSITIAAIHITRLAQAQFERSHDAKRVARRQAAKQPISGIVGCCAPASSGHAAA